MSILIIYRPPTLGSNPCRGFKFVKEFKDFLWNKLSNTDMIVWNFNLYVEDVKDSKNLAFQDLFESFG